MARLTAPLLSLGASGTIGKAITFSSWKGIPYARTRVIPYNPKTDAQKEVRGVFATLNEMWKRMPAEARLPWNYAVRGLPLTARNRFIQVNLPLLKDDADLSDIQLGVATGQAVPPIIEACTDNEDGTFGILIAMPTAPVGYTFADPWCFCVLTGDPSPVLTRTMYAQAILGAGPSWEMDVDDNGVYEVGAVCFYTRDSDSKAFCSIADMSRVTVTGN